MPITIRPARASDEAAISAIETKNWLPHVTPAPYQERPFFSTAQPEEVLVAVLDDSVIGFVVIKPASAMPSHAHVLMVQGLGVAPAARGQGVAAQLLAAVDQFAVAHEAERVTLRVLGVNAAARALYERAGFHVEGVLRDEFRLPVGPGGELVPVDDVLMAKTVASPRDPAPAG